MAAKEVLVSYNECNKLMKIPPQPEGGSEVKFLQAECMKLFKFSSNVSLDVVFQKYNSEWDAWVDIDGSYMLEDREKFKMVVQPSLNDTVKSVSSLGNEVNRVRVFWDQLTCTAPQNPLLDDCTGL
jgi:hypothetical protein